MISMNSTMIAYLNLDSYVEREKGFCNISALNFFAILICVRNVNSIANSCPIT